ncbi:Transcriptional regulator [hydrothermal vent metagenome]|uniref:Transcriptional regulator n=1 Tax=hydrothermal vent metagenome TaxID=652676 RepID=A0A1W1BL74_9ZZZZ
MKKTSYHHGNLKEEFLKIAFNFIKKEDIDRLTLKILSEATGTSRSAIYRHFSSKDALIETMIKSCFSELDKEISPILVDKSIEIIDRFNIAFRNYLEFVKNNPHLYQLLFAKRYAHIREDLVTTDDSDSSGFANLKKAIQEGQESGILKKEDIYHQTITVWASLHGLSLLLVDGFLDVEDIYEELSDMMIKNILAGLVI